MLALSNLRAQNYKKKSYKCKQWKNNLKLSIKRKMADEKKQNEITHIFYNIHTLPLHFMTPISAMRQTHISHTADMGLTKK